eukprot:TRINITY_DN4313_c0_g1_i1.p1 TRINITY_DN4313_c0_g1~~TRINITY_DN4313_c0_g1_i1.p1  ORF type:complete len:324 (+),score=20.17 TRINITY_DN4313_c0_g1_i1:114-1085(+)
MESDGEFSIVNSYECGMSNDPVCWVENEPITLDLVVGFLIFFGTLITFFPQYFQLFKEQSSEGISSFTLFLGSIANTAYLLSSIDDSWGDIWCCTIVDGWKCFRLLITLAYIFLGWLCWHGLYIVSLIYFPLPKTSSDEENSKYKKLSIFMFAIYFIFLNVGLSLTIFWNYNSYHTGIWLNVDRAFGIISSFSAAFIWVPQIYLTSKTKETGSLSVIFLIFMTIGSAVSLYILITQKVDELIWAPVLAGFIFELIFNGLYAYTYYNNYKQIKDIVIHHSQHVQDIHSSSSWEESSYESFYASGLLHNHDNEDANPNINDNYIS